MYGFRHRWIQVDHTCTRSLITLVCSYNVILSLSLSGTLSRIALCPITTCTCTLYLCLLYFVWANQRRRQCYMYIRHTAQFKWWRAQYSTARDNGNSCKPFLHRKTRPVRFKVK